MLPAVESRSFPGSLNPTQEFWAPYLFLVGREPELEWVSAMYSDMFAHETPEAFITMVGALEQADFTQPLPRYDLISATDEVAAAAGFVETAQSLSTGYDGLLAVYDEKLRSLMEERQLVNKPLLVVGGIDPSSLFCVLRWLQANNLEHTPVTFVDISPLKTQTLIHLREKGYWSWPGGVEMVTSSIEEFAQDDRNQEKFGVVLMDIVSASVIPNVFQRGYSTLSDPFEKYAEILKSIQTVTSPTGLSLQRTLAWQDIRNPEYRPLSDADVEQIITNSNIEDLVPPNLISQLSRKAVAERIQGRFSITLPDIPCGLTYFLEEEPNIPHYPTRPFVEASDAMLKLYHEVYETGNVETLRIAKPQNEMYFQYFLCG